MRGRVTGGLSRRALALAAVGLMVAAAAYVLLHPSHYDYRPLDVMPVFVQDHHADPGRWIAALIAREGGLPRTGVGLTHYGADVGLVRPVEVYPVADWELHGISLRTPYGLAEALRRQELGYGISIEVAARYADGVAAVFRWDTWRYGFTLGPVALDQGGGPAGDLVLISLE